MSSVIRLIGFLCLFLTLVAATSVPAADFYVQKSLGQDSNPGDGWGAGRSLSTVGRAIELANAGAGADTIHVAAGTYPETITPVSSLSLLGGYPAAGGTERDPAANPAILDGEGLNDPVVTISGVDNVLLDGFLIRNGSHTGRGGGLDIEDSQAVTISQNTVTANTVTEDWGGGIAVVNSAVAITGNNIHHNVTNTGGGGLSLFNGCTGTISQNIIENNTAYEGGGIKMDSSNLTIASNTVTNNTALGQGGGLDIDSCPTSVIRQNNITGNQSSGDGGGMSVVDSSVLIDRNLIIQNTAVNWGGGIRLVGSGGEIVNNFINRNSVQNEVGGGISYYGQANTALLNNTITNNTSTNGGGVYCHDDSTAALTNNIVRGNIPDQLQGHLGTEITANYCNVTGGYPGNGNIDLEARFKKANGYQLRGGSPCIDAGVNTGAPDHDIDGRNRPKGPRVDMGAYEFHGPPVAATLGPLLND